ncbi:hypothetical protein OEG84_00995 [Hoeflea sp. G2-23]|uniref:Uncharacterized protein n=1 Tax=Hoeflea algicola TaxID=2983763 RepID=A0ABT3Z4U2_9HYPH|nr:hypothetical protein [Hoeflea algicola]MCY0146331.1 hypothetical protein [Hoeflea algicola]
MIESFAGVGPSRLSGAKPMAAGEAVLIDQLIDLVLSLEPFEIKQGEPSGAPGSTRTDAVEDGAEMAGRGAGLSSRSTRAMLRRMRAVLDREAARLGDDGLEGKAAVDQVALIARTLEKIDQLERLIAEDEARAAGTTLSGEEREQLRQTVRQLILAAAARMAAEQAGKRDGMQTGTQEAVAGESEIDSDTDEPAGQSISDSAGDEDVCSG